MTVKLLFLIFSLALLSITGAAQNDYRPGKKDLSWGAESDGLRMAVWTNPAANKIFAAVRNSSAKKICYCQVEGNNFTVYARKNAASPWQELKFKTPLQEVVILPICTTGTLTSNEEMPSYVVQNGARKKKNYSFSVDLREYIFPADWSGTVEIKITQSNVYCDKHKNELGDVESPAFKIKLPFSD